MNLLKRMAVSGMALVASVGLLVGSLSQTADAATLTGKVVVAGSTALLPLTQQAANDFKQINPKVKISVSGSSSIAGPQSVLNGSATIGACDWDATKAVKGFKAFSGLVANKVSVTVFATIVNKSNTVSNLTTAQLQGIFSGKITNWKQVGGKDAPIVVVNRKNGSGTRVNFQIKALHNIDFMTSGNYKEVGKSGDMATAVGTDPNAIGFIDLPYVKGDIKAVKLNGVSPTTANVLNHKYSVWAYGYLLTKGKPTGANAAYIKYIQSSKFQNGVVAKLKFIPISSMK